MFSEEVTDSLALVRRLVSAFVVLIIVSQGSFVGATRHDANIEQITGLVLAYDDLKPSLTCVENCETSLIVRLDPPSDKASSYIRVDLKFGDRRNFPRELINGTRRWQFKVVRTTDRDEKLQEFILGEDVYGKEFKSPIWKRVPGTEGETLPFGEVLPSYSLVKRGFNPAGV